METGGSGVWWDRTVTSWFAGRRRHLRLDLALAGASFAVGLVLIGMGNVRVLPTGGHTPPTVFAVFLFTACVAVALRRFAPRTSLAVGTAALVADLVAGGSLATSLVYTQVLYDACVYGPPRLWRWLLRIAVALTVLGAVAGVLVARSWQGVALGVLVILVAVLPVVTGISVRQYRDQAAEARARAEQTARLAELDRRQAVLAERHRMARELHDVIANQLSAVAIHATAALSVRDLDRAQLDQALRVIRENSVRGLAEMRQMIGLLREPADPMGPADDGPGEDRPSDDGPVGGVPVGGPGAADPPTRVRLAEVDRLVRWVGDAGLTVRLDTVGAARPLPISVDLAAYRIVQEALTNALKHGCGETTVTVGYRPDEVTVTVENPLPTDGPVGATLPGAGAGLIGMRERAALLHGRFDAGRHGDRWRVHAELPTGETRE
ncbi:histidine kinase [Micromonospora zhanjiangensis]